MQPELTLTLTIILLFVGINMSANNTLHSAILNALFYNDTISRSMIRILGIGIIASALLLLLGLSSYTFITVSFITLIFIYLLIKGRSKSALVKEQKRAEALRAYNQEIMNKKRQIEDMRRAKEKALLIAEKKKKQKNVQEIKENLWDDGSMTNKELIDRFQE
ncbi:hypothetical protein [Petrocella sp. FN5]|uniref:hypothetical protein n=1 Tax=Petrocella sp. FN5 TaxID=3032002 RepID=UPI0023D9ED63|nr:hypothetical protein [Petrocella sp. FN5]MDF1617364.1 hypothetical protein [Petrocella sp. FN5]